jgi:curved DNA-binding protein CbpA
VTTSKTYYELLEVPPTASQEEVKRAFRQQIAKYHPDKVHHLGQEFQEIAAERAAELTEAYRILSDEGRRGEYDRTRAAAPPGAAGVPPPSTPHRAAPEHPTAETAESLADQASTEQKGAAFKQERATRDEFVRKATVGRFRQILAKIGADYEESQVRGFDFACIPKSKMFSRKGPRLLGRFVSRVDGPSVADAWMQATKWGAPSSEEICVFLMGSAVAPPRELADAIAEQRRKSKNSKVTLIPVDARDWSAHMPTDAPTIAKTLLTQLKSGT